MESTRQTSRRSLTELPLHIVAGILAKLDAIQQLFSAILSHRIFRDAFKDNFHSVARGIITTQIPPETLPFLIALRESTRVNARDYTAARDLLMRLTTATSGMTSATLPPSAHLSLSDYNFLSRNYAEAEFLARSMAEEVIPIATQRLSLNRHSSEISQQENFRLTRAFLRFQLMVNLFCLDENIERSIDGETNHLLYLFFCSFSPWVNGQLVSVYVYLERKVSDVFDDIVAHEVSWYDMRYTWHHQTTGCPHIQAYLTQGLPFLSSAVRAKTYDERIHLLGRYGNEVRVADCNPRRQFLGCSPYAELLGLGLPGGTLLEDYSPAQLELLVRPSDGAQDSMASDPYHFWYRANLGHSILCSVACTRDWKLLEGGYVLWDYADISEVDFEGLFKELRDKPHYFQSYRRTWPRGEVLVFQERKKDIHLSGGSGYWPRNGLDFSRIHGLSEETKTELVKKWKGY
ncbi:hypothetical protein K449DRAFT_421626 [Hypoxylon sp. EC38]|nr:hypothetical protein K449DRAFT_421626 [Hypoxylon sp. EC38]